MYIYCKLILYQAYVFQVHLMGGGGGLFERGGLLLNLVNDGISSSWKTTMQSIFMKYQYVYEVGGHTVEDRKQIWTSSIWINHQSTWSVSVVIN